jgi:hypothetical protein
MSIKKPILGLLILAVAAIVFSACKTEISPGFYDSKSDVKYQKQCNYYPKGYRSRSDANFPGVIALVKEKLIFEPATGRSDDKDILMYPLRIDIPDIDSATVSDAKGVGLKVLTVWTITDKHDFFMKGADSLAILLNK